MQVLREHQWFDHATVRPGSLAHDVIRGLVEGSRGRRWSKGTWLVSIAEWTGLG